MSEHSIRNEHSASSIPARPLPLLLLAPPPPLLLLLMLMLGGMDDVAMTPASSSRNACTCAISKSP
jgi:hypothetical protein